MKLDNLLLMYWTVLDSATKINNLNLEQHKIIKYYKI